MDQATHTVCSLGSPVYPQLRLLIPDEDSHWLELLFISSQILWAAGFVGQISLLMSNSRYNNLLAPYDNPLESWSPSEGLLLVIHLSLSPQHLPSSPVNYTCVF